MSVIAAMWSQSMPCARPSRSVVKSSAAKPWVSMSLLCLCSGSTIIQLVLPNEKKNLVARFHRRRHELAVLDPFRRDQLGGDLVDLRRAAADDDGLEAIVLVEMDVETCVDRNLRLVLHVRQNIS